MFGSKIFLASQDASLRKKLKNILSKNGYNVVGEAEDGINALRIVRSMEPDLVIVDFELPGMAVGEIIEEDNIAPVIIISSSFERGLAEKARESWIFAFLVLPIDERNLIATAESTMINYERLNKLKKEVAKLRNTLETRKVVEKAKGLLMEQMELSESEAFRMIQHQSMEKAIPMKKVAEAIILTFDIGKKKQ